MSLNTSSSLDNRTATNTSPHDSIQDSSSDDSSQCHSPATQKENHYISFKTRTSTKQKSQQRNLDETSSLEYSSSSSEHTHRQLRPSSTISKTTNATNRKTKTNRLTSDWESFFSANRLNTATKKQSIPIKQWNQSTIPTPNSFQSDNKPFGDNIVSFPDNECFFFHNINGVKDEANWLQINKTMHELNVTCFGFSEINTTFRGISFQKWNDITRKTFRQSRMIASESDISYESNYKPGGTLTTIVGKWQSRISERGTDPSGLGRWSYFRISSQKKNIIIITAYKPIKTQGPHTTWTQQWMILRETQQNPDPIKVFCDDLAKATRQWAEKGYEIILMIDANEEVGTTPGGLSNVISSAGLFDLIDARHNATQYPNTYARGTKRIDYIFGTERIRQFCVASGIMPFGYGYPSDHRAVFIRCDLGKILSTEIHPLESISTRLLSSATPKEREKFITELDLHYEAQDLYNRLQKLWNVNPPDWDDHHTSEFNKCDEQHIIGMISAEKKTCKIKTTSWSPKYSKAVEDKAFWKIALSLRRTYTKPYSKFLTWAHSRNIDDFSSIDTARIAKELRAAQAALRAIKKEADQLRETHLRDLLNITREANDDRQHEHRLQILIRAHKQQKSYRRIRQILKPQAKGGLAYVLAPENFQAENYPYDPQQVERWSMVHEPEELKKLLMHRNITHFGQAHGTPFTTPPLNKIKWSANDDCSESLIGGQVPQEILSGNTYVDNVIKEMAAMEKLPEIDTYISSDDVARGFKRWKETTSTSPSGCHLGLRRIPAIPFQDKDLDKARLDILNVQTLIINIPLHMGFAPNRWKTVVNAMLEKVPGTPLLHKLRVIHILEADYNLTLKTIFGRRLMKNCERHGTLGDLQDGFRKGRSTTRTLLHNEIFNDFNKRLRIDNYVGMTDISGCFDRIIPSIISLLNRKNGCPPEAVQMHAQTLEQAKYHLKTQHGISEEFYSNTITPVYGTGQGAGDSPSQWSQESALLFQLYTEMVNSASMCDRYGNNKIEIPLAAFADDTNLLGNNNDMDKTREVLAQEAKQAFATWNGLLHATGHFMELPKCSCYLQIWNFQEDGYAFTEDPDTHGIEIQVEGIDGIIQTIPQLKSNKSQKLLGVMKNPMGNQQDEIIRLKTKSDNIAKKINSNKLSRADAKIAYEVFYIPAIRYSLNITAINQVDLETAQSKATLAFLSAQGYNRHMPREIVFAPSLFQGLGFQHMYDLQGSDSTRLLLQELNQADTMTHKMLIALLDAIQLESGIGQPILEKCKALTYIEWGWIPQIRDFLWHINGKIIGATKAPPTYRIHDSYIMDSKHLENLSRRDQLYVHRCRIHLQVETLSDIVSADGTKILEVWRHPEKTRPSRSITRWPRQAAPFKAAWRVWSNFLDSFNNSSGNLKNPLGAWTQQNTSRQHSTYFHHAQQTLWTRQGQLWHLRQLLRKHRLYWTFHSAITDTRQHLSPLAVPIDIMERDDSIIRTSPAANIQQVQPTTTNNAPWYKKPYQSFSHLTGQISMLMDTDEIPQTLQNKVHFEIASDGGHDPDTGISTFGWTAAANKVLIAKGRGPAQAHPSMAESFRSEGYGLSSVLIFIANMVEHYNINPTDHKWTIYIDNMALIKRLEGYSTNIPVPRWNLRSDEDITHFAKILMSSIPARLVHIHSHQDDNSDWHNLSFPAQLNTIADEQASLQRQLMDGPETDVVNLAQAQLRIDNIAITRDSQRALLQAAGKIPLQEYYSTKLGWTKKVFASVNWQAQRKALNSFNTADQTRILKFVHGWLPTQSRLHKEGSATTPRCKLCHDLHENNRHLLTCKHPGMQAIQENITTYFMKQYHDHGNSELINILQIAMEESLQDSTWTPSSANVSPEWKNTLQEQSEIGWSQIVNGRIANSMIHQMEAHYRTLNINSKQYTGERWARKLIINIWTTVLHLWKQRNTLIYETDTLLSKTAQRDKLEARIQRCYHFKDRLKSNDRRQWFDRDIHEKLQEDPSQLKTWLLMMERLIRIEKREQKKRPKESMLMHRFLGLNTTHQQEDIQQAHIRHPRAYQQELNPD